MTSGMFWLDILAGAGVIAALATALVTMLLPLR
jgi:hypothetical protein